MKKHLYPVLMVVVFTGFFSLQNTLHAKTLKDTDVPEALLKWKSWVLYDMDDKLCPTNYNDAQAYRCAWPSRLNMDIHKTGGSFEQAWTIFKETWAPLPGGADLWPEDVKDHDNDAPVIGRNKMPFLKLQAGTHVIKGRFLWKEMPEMILVPSETGIVSLTINGTKIDYPVIDRSGGLWLQKRAASEDQENTQSLSIFRLLQDTIPMEIISHLQLNISGQAREIRFENVLLNNSVPMRLNSPLPVRIADNGELMIQARPGRWELDITSRIIGPVTQLGPLSCDHGQEIWSFAPQNHLRMVKIEGVPSVEPGRTNMPSEWKQYSAYGVESGASIQFNLLKRGDPDPAPDRLTLTKTLWLDFNGDGFTVQDHITGTISRTWRLSMNAPGELGRVMVDGQGQLITADEKTGNAGIELRKGQLDLKADSRYTASTTAIPAVGWDHDISAMTGVLNLPPGWKLFAAKGIDKMPDTWILKWTLLDFFLVLIIAAAVFKLKGWKWGIIAFITMVSIYHEAGSPKIIWLHILAAIALIPVLPDNRFKQLVYFWGGAAGVVLILIVIPFMVGQVRHGIFPQLDLPYPYFQARDNIQMTPSRNEEDGFSQSIVEQEPMLQKAKEVYSPRAQQDKGDTRFLSRSIVSGKGYEKKKTVFTQDPNALIQTGPGLPSWQWRRLPMTWNGPVNTDQEIRLWLISPFQNLVLSFLRVILLALMITGMIDIRTLWQKVKTTINKTALVTSVLALFVGISHAETDAGFFPPKELLETYQNRLLEKADCFPNCADCLKMDVNVQSDHLRILLEIHAVTKTAVPLPGSMTSWLPDQVLMDDMPQKELSRDANGILWALVSEGIHRMVLTGKTGAGNSIEIPLPLKPHTAAFASDGWDVKGIHKDGKVESGIQLTRLKKETTDTSLSGSISLPPFLHIERVISLGLTWEVSTTVIRVTPSGTPIVVSVPLIEGESVTTAGIRVENNIALVNMEPGTTHAWWTSSLKPTARILLKAPENVPWTETWILDASPIWHCEPSGLPVVHHQDEQGQWKPNWQPWPGESVFISVTRPKALPGKIMTIDSARLLLTPGLRSNTSRLALQIRASQGGQHQITLPEKADLQVVKIDDKTQPIRQENRKVVIPIQPGTQSVVIEWNSPSSSAMLIKGPAIRIGEQAVNADVSFQMPHDRWILWAFGPRLGPAVLYWSYVFIIVLVALGLGRIPITPLKTFHWLILSLGLTQIPVFMALMAAGWFLILGLRKKYQPPGNPFYFNLCQLGIFLWTLSAFFCLYAAVSEGLLGIPDMQIAGNGSTASRLNWTQDRISALVPQPFVISLPKMVYNVMILIWALWLALYLIKWLRWGWGCFSEGGIWKKPERKHRKRLSDSPGTE
ncbi:MAG: hypothetical protein KJ737_20025 [Proteobacteria bacterium]|nr:hypothetical protein [Pseudomonadota bacterium]